MVFSYEESVVWLVTSLREVLSMATFLTVPADSELRDVWFPLESEVKAHANTKVTQMQFNLCSQLSTNTMPNERHTFTNHPLASPRHG